MSLTVIKKAAASVATPAAGKVAVFVDESGDLQAKDESGTVTELGGGGGGAVDSVFGRTGAVVAVSGDYDFSEIGSKPTTLAGYGITDAASVSHTHAAGDITSGTFADARIAASNVTQHQASLALAGSQITSGTVPPAQLGSGTSISTKFLRGDSTWQTISGGGDALTTNPLSQFAATTSAQLAGVISDETGSGALVFANSPTLTTPNIGTATGSASLNVLKAGDTMTGKLTAVAPTTSTASVALPHGTAPTSPSNGDVWTTTAGLYVRVNGSTVGPLGINGIAGDLIVGNGAPDDGADGVDGQVYLDYSTGDVYGPKASGAWGLAAFSLAGTDGTDGEDGLGTKQDVSISSGTLTIDYSAGRVAYVNLNANITSIVITNWPTTGTLGKLSIRFTADGTARTIAWPAATDWDGGTAPTPPSTSGHRMWVHLVSADALTTIDAFLGSQAIQ